VTPRSVPGRATVLLADDHAIVVEGLSALLGAEFSLVGTAADGTGLIEAAQRLRPGVIVTDMSMPGPSGIELLRRLKADAPAAKIIVLTMHADVNLAAEALRAGASGFVVKHAAGKELITAIRTVLQGARYIAPPLTDGVLAALAEGPARAAGSLTPRQREVVTLLAQGRTMKEVAAALGLSPRTVETHKYQVMQEHGLQTTADLVRYALEYGLIRPATPS